MTSGQPKRIGITISSIEDSAVKAREATSKFNMSVHPVLISLAKVGWYINESGPIFNLISLKKYLDNSDIEKVNEMMSTQITNDYKHLKKRTLEVFDDKREILNRAFKAFEKKQYEYSILLLLTQTDSICRNLVGSRWFGGIKTKPFADKHFDEQSFISAVIQPIADTGEINKAEKHYTQGEFNRHKIIHGEATNYGTLQNALKVISLIFYLATLASRAENK